MRHNQACLLSRPGVIEVGLLYVKKHCWGATAYPLMCACGFEPCVAVWPWAERSLCALFIGATGGKALWCAVCRMMLPFGVHLPIHLLSLWIGTAAVGLKGGLTHAVGLPAVLAFQVCQAGPSTWPVSFA